MDTLINSELYKSLNDIARSSHAEDINAKPFPHIVLDSFLSPEIANQCVAQFPDLSRIQDSEKHLGRTDNKLASPRGTKYQNKTTSQVFSYLNSSEFIEFLQILTGIKEPLIVDPHFLGGGFHQIQPGGFLKVHVDFCKHPETRLDRRLNVLLYLNKEWDNNWGGNLELYSPNMAEVKKIAPLFNRLVIFATTDYTYHGHPDPLQTPEGVTRKSMALYYYSNGRPTHELRSALKNQSTLYKERTGEKFRFSFKHSIRELLPPIIFKGVYYLSSNLKAKRK